MRAKFIQTVLNKAVPNSQKTMHPPYENQQANAIR